MLVCSVRYGYQNTSLEYYEQVVKGKEFDVSAEDSAAYAFAYAISNGFRPWVWKKDSYRGSIKNSDQSRAAYFRDRAFKLKPNSPEILVMQAFAETMGTNDGRRKAYPRLVKATKLAPKWADAHYWLGWAANNYALTMRGRDAKVQKAKANLGRQMLKSYSKAEKLDSYLKPHLYLERIHAYKLIDNQKFGKEISQLIDAHFKAFPYYVAWIRKNDPDATEASIRGYLMP